MMFVSVTTKNFGRLSPSGTSIFVSRLAAFQTHQRPRRMKLCGGLEDKLNTSSLAIWEKEERSKMLQLGQLHRPTAEAVRMPSCITGA